MEKTGKVLGFQRSEFRGKEGITLEARRWWVQFVTLMIKNAKVLSRKGLYVFIFLLLPMTIVLTFMAEKSTGRGTAYDDNLPALDINMMSTCHVWYEDECVRITYAPSNTVTDSIMSTVANYQGFSIGNNVLGFDNVQSAQSYVASNLGKVEYTVFFRDEVSPLWTNDYYNGTDPTQTDISSYVIFYNESISWADGRSSLYKVNVQLLALQKSIEAAYLREVSSSTFSSYNVSYGQFWNTSAVLSESDDVDYSPTQIAEMNQNKNCLYSTLYNMDTVGYLMPWVCTYSMIALSIIAFRLVAEERQKNLFGFLRRLGLMDSAYWASWFVTMQVLQIAACAIALVAMAGIRSVNTYEHPSNALQKLDYSAMFMILWAGSTCFVASAFFMASICTSSNAATAITFAQFLIAFICIVTCGVQLNTFTPSGYTGSGLLGFECYFIPSSYNTIYSTKGLQGATFVQFLVFFMPWFHLSQALTNVISLVRYDTQNLKVTLTENWNAPPVDLSFTTSPGYSFDAPWIAGSCAYMIYSSIIFLFIAWFVAQVMSTDGGEGRPVLSILFPPFVRKYLSGREEVVEVGDIRGQERLRSVNDGSVRAYKLSKSYFGGVQALKEVSFEMKKGEVFVLLGHNGAGKSTLINIVTGLIAPTRGKTFLAGLDVAEDVAEVQQMLGVCPQDDVLWDDLTAMDHMLLVSAFKGMSASSLYSPLFTDASTPQAAESNNLFQSVQHVLQEVQLLDRCNDFASTFSGGMRRRLSVALSTVGDVDVIFFDEPTTGLDPLSRRRVWDTINRLKQDRVVLLTTHNMEEADALGDNIMILHGGQVKAVGDSLTLKNMYGQGYQVQVMTESDKVEEFVGLMGKLMPGSSCAHDEDINPGMCSISVGKADVRGLPRLFSWLEGSAVAHGIVKEWTISNTTLEQVFLTLCVQNNSVNFVADGQTELETQQLMLCPMCRIRPRQAVITRRYGATKDVVALPDSVCRECAASNDFFKITEKEADAALADDSGSMLSNLIEKAQVALENSITNDLLQDIEAFTERDESDFSAPRSGSVHSPIASITNDEEPSLPAEAASKEPSEQAAEGDAEVMPRQEEAPRLSNPPPKMHPLAQRGFRNPPRVGNGPVVHRGAAVEQRRAQEAYGDKFSGSAGSPLEQVMAVWIKNNRLQAKQRCSNICSACFIATMFLLLYVMSLLLASTGAALVQCSAGYVSINGCSEATLQQWLFNSDPVYASVVSEVTDIANMDSPNATSEAYLIRNYLVPAEQTNAQTFSFNGMNTAKIGSPGFQSEISPNGGLPTQQQDRDNILWSSFISTPDDTLYQAPGFGFKMRAPPSGVSTANNNAPNLNQLDSQNTQSAALRSASTSSQCPYYIDSTYDVGSATDAPYVPVEEFGAVYSDAAIQCQTCVNSAVDVNTSYVDVMSRSIDFNGTIWLSKNLEPTQYDQGLSAPCGNIGCMTYEFAFRNFQNDETDPDTQYLYDTDCPTGYGYYSKSPSQETSQTQNAATYVNLVTNMLRDPFMRNFTIQGAYSAYGGLLMNGYIIAQRQSFFLIFFSMVLMNGVWPLAVWRLGHEMSLGLEELMRAMGLRPWVYLIGMYTYDNLVSMVLGSCLIGFAVGLELLSFKDAPVGLLIAVVFTSSIAFNGASLVMTKYAGNKAGVMSLVAACLTVFMAILCPILTNFLYPEEGEWPNALSLIPYLAQSRALYVILVYHRSSQEADIAMGLMFTFGIVCLGIVILIAERERLVLAINDVIGDHEQEQAALDKLLTEGHTETATRQEETEVTQRDARRSQMQDVAAEKARARKYVMYMMGLSGANVEEGNQLSDDDKKLVTVLFHMFHKYAEDNPLTLVRRFLSFDGKNTKKNASPPIIQHGGGRVLAVAESSEEVAEMEMSRSTTAEDILTRQSEAQQSLDRLADEEGWAVRGMSLSLSLGECFGLLGPNGAGKSTTISILIGRLTATLGKQFVAGLDLKRGTSAVHQYIGVCPQFDVIWPDLSVEEHLMFQARQRGIPSSKIGAAVQIAAMAVHLDGDAYNTKAAGLSGGMRRRLTIAMAIIGDPPIILMDEPTTGLDPDNRQQVWKIIQSLKSPNRLILLTTHSMEEAEALCTRIGIMAKGRLRCVGSSQHLKTQFGKGYTLTVNCVSEKERRAILQGSIPAAGGENGGDNGKDSANDIFAALDAFVLHDVGQGKASKLMRINRTTRYLLEKHHSVSVADIFRKLEANRRSLGIREWGLAMTTLEEVFVSAVSEGTAL